MHPEAFSDALARLQSCAAVSAACIAIARALRESLSGACPLSLAGCEPQPGTVCESCSVAVPC